MRQRALGEDAAYALLRSAAMTQGRRLVEVAGAVISAEDLLGGRP